MKRAIKNKINRFIKKPSLIAGLALLLVFFYEYYGKDMGAKEIGGRAVRVIDGDTISLNGTKIRLKGIDAPESKQECKYQEADKVRKYKCGIESAEYLSHLIDGKTVECTDEGKDLYGRTLSYCYVGTTNINRQMVRDGWAIGYDDFAVEEWWAKQNKAGLWKGEFQKPAEWRKSRKKRK